MKKHLAPLAAAALLASAAASAAVLTPGTPVTGTLDGDPAGLLGAPDFAGNASTVADGFDSVEFIAADFSFQLDIGSDGLLRLYDNTGTGALAGTRVIRLSFADAALALAPPRLADGASLLSGAVQLQLLGPQAVQLTLADLRFDAPYASVGIQLAPAPVPEPAPAALLALGLLGLAWRRHGHRGRR
ncbi:MAG: PEP-CTERM sorting domain-containing protein [Roseateles sp.]|uniref:PEP-CTERM sorting domain-containing protein n=1 Tax=Roseateles sp. TaxID=1971397 RepID=UPI0039EABD46